MKKYKYPYKIISVGSVEMDFKALKNWKNWTVEDIINESNAEKRRIMVEFYGVDKFLLDAGAEAVHEDSFGRLYTLDFDGDIFQYVQVENQTIEPGAENLTLEQRKANFLSPRGHKYYFLEVTREQPFNSAKDAVAFTWGLTAEEYDPDVES